MPKRRANHEGTIYKRQDGRWVASLTLPGGKRKAFYGRTRQEVAQKLTVGLKARQDGSPLPSEQLKIGPYLQDCSGSVSIHDSNSRTVHSVIPLERQGLWNLMIPVEGRLSKSPIVSQEPHTAILYPCL